jgi:ketosteroid isomerase-like protein
MPSFSRETIAVAAALFALGAAVGALVYFQPQRFAARTVHAFLDAFEDGDTATISALISPDYADAAGFTQAEILRLARRVRGEMSKCAIYRARTTPTAADVSSDDRETATLGFVLWVNGRGRKGGRLIPSDYFISPKMPVDFSLKRRSWLPWDWVIVSIKTPDPRALRRHLPEPTEE